MSSAASHSPCRVARPTPTSSPAPTACDTVGFTADTVPMHIRVSEKNVLEPSTAPAIAPGPSRPIITTSTKLMAICASCAAASGAASATVGRASRARARMVDIRVVDGDPS